MPKPGFTLGDAEWGSPVLSLAGPSLLTSHVVFLPSSCLLHAWMLCFTPQNQLSLAALWKDAPAAGSAPSQPQASCSVPPRAAPKPSQGTLGWHHTINQQCSSRELALEAGKAEENGKEV